MGAASEKFQWVAEAAVDAARANYAQLSQTLVLYKLCAGSVGEKEKMADVMDKFGTLEHVSMQAGRDGKVDAICLY